MRKLLSVFSFIMVLSMVLSACGTATPTAAPATEAVAPTAQPAAPVDVAKVQIYWYIGLGTGSQAAQIPQEKAWVDNYNATQGAADGIQLITIIVDNKYARDNLTAQIAAGNAPDIVGPMGTEGRGYFPGGWLDLQPMVAEFNYDISDIDPAFLEFYKDQGALVGLPFAIFPSAVFYNKDLFDQAGLAYPPHKVGDKYVLNGEELTWDFDTVAKIAKLMTLDSAGKNSGADGFDKAGIVQWGFDFQWTKDSPRWFSAYFEPFYPVVDGKAKLSDGQVAAIKWYYDAMWGAAPFLPTQAAMDSDLIKGNSFNSGKVAMGLSHLWYTCCITAPSAEGATVKNWDVAVVPSYNGKTTAKLHGDTFGIMKDSKNPKEAFKVYGYMLGAGSADLYKIYGGLPARKGQQAAFFEALTKTFAPNVVDWQVFLDMIPYIEVPGHELTLPNVAKSQDIFLTMGSDLRSNPDLDVDARIAKLLADLDASFAEVAK